jgi:hypothetical protein
MIYYETIDPELYDYLLEKGGKVSVVHLINMIAGIEPHKYNNSIIKYVDIILKDLKTNINFTTPNEGKTIIASLLYHEDLYYLIKELINNNPTVVLYNKNLLSFLDNIENISIEQRKDMMLFLIDKGFE